MILAILTKQLEIALKTAGNVDCVICLNMRLIYNFPFQIKYRLCDLIEDDTDIQILCVVFIHRMQETLSLFLSLNKHFSFYSSGCVAENC